MIGPQGIESKEKSTHPLKAHDRSFTMTTDNGHPEQQYLDLVSRIITTGQVRKDRTGTGTQSLFAPPQLRFSLLDSCFPLLTTKQVFARPVFEELMWFLRGQTDATILSKKRVHIWDANGSREALDKLGFTNRRDGDLGPVYGFQWRHFGAEYIDCDTDYTGQGVDQLAQVIHKILFSPCDRRIIISAWNPQALSNMALPPCHMFCQFYVTLPSSSEERPKLSCQLYQRSCDMGLGVPFNIASYSLLTMLIAHICGLEAYEFIHCMGDAHVYLDHVEPLKEQLNRNPYPFPRLEIQVPFGIEDAKAKGMSNDEIVADCVKRLEAVEYKDLIFKDYKHHPKVEMKMSV